VSRAEGNKLSIVSSKPQESILIYQMASINPGEMMPELGRILGHNEGVALISDWIRKIKTNYTS
jgi:hypothetical protein